MSNKVFAPREFRFNLSNTLVVHLESCGSDAIQTRPGLKQRKAAAGLPEQKLAIIFFFGRGRVVKARQEGRLLAMNQAIRTRNGPFGVLSKYHFDVRQQHLI